MLLRDVDHAGLVGLSIGGAVGVVIDEMDALNAALLRFLQESVKTTALK